jgi:hypothetical protein
MLGGDVCVTTRAGEGSTFTLTVATGDLDGVPLFDPRKRTRAAVAWREDLRTVNRRYSHSYFCCS